MPCISIRSLMPSDTSSLTVLLHLAVHSTAPQHYTHTQVAAWSPAPMTAHQFLARLTEHYSVFVAVDAQDEPMGFIELRTEDQNGYIDCFYCHPDYAHQGIGRQLYDTLIQEAQTLHLQQLQVHSSLAAKSFFTKRGFEEIRQETVVRNGSELHNFLMQRTL